MGLIRFKQAQHANRIAKKNLKATRAIAADAASQRSELGDRLARLEGARRRARTDRDADLAAFNVKMRPPSTTGGRARNRVEESYAAVFSMIVTFVEPLTNTTEISPRPHRYAI